MLLSWLLPWLLLLLLLLPYLRWPPRPYVVLDAISRHDSDKQQYNTLHQTHTEHRAVGQVSYAAADCRNNTLSRHA